MKSPAAASGPLTIYAARDDQSDRYRYVGITKGTLTERLKRHIGVAKTFKERRTAFHDWLLDGQKGKTLIALEQTQNPKREIYWIKRLLSQGHPLLNVNHNAEYPGVACGECGEPIRSPLHIADGEVRADGTVHRFCTACEVDQAAFESIDESGYNFVLAD